MEGFTVINYQGSKSNLSDFIIHNLKSYIKSDKAIFDIFSGAGSVCNLLRDDHIVFANDVEAYASVIAEATLKKTGQFLLEETLSRFHNYYSEILDSSIAPIEVFLKQEADALKTDDFSKLTIAYSSYPTVWNNRYSEITKGYLTVKTIKEINDYYLFTTYYASNYYGISQALEIDCIVKTIDKHFPELKKILLTCLFYAMKETVFSKDGHMAQPLSLEKNQKRLFVQRKKSIYEFFRKKLGEYASLKNSKYPEKNKVFNSDFEELLNETVFSNVGLVYADPPYTDMQYSRYYHLLNMAVKYDYPELTRGIDGYTKGLYTEGRYQSKLSQRGSAKKALEKLISFCSSMDINLALSYAYPQDREKQATDRYTVTIDELIILAKKYYSDDRVDVVSQNYNHANHRNSKQKKVVEYLILCGDKNNEYLDTETLKKKLALFSPTKNNSMYNSHMYWSQKSYNICDVLIDAFSDKGDVVFDPFLGSGVTVLEAINKTNSRCAIGCEINDMPLFISKLLLSINDIPDIKSIMERFITEIGSLDSYYETICPICGGRGIISKVIFDKPERNGSDIEIRAINYSCSCTKKGVKQADKADYEKINYLRKLKNIHNTQLIHNSKIAVSEKDDVKNIFTGRNISVLDDILGIIKSYDVKYQSIMKYILISILHLCKITDKHANSQWPLWIPKKDCVEKNVIDIYVKKIRKFYEVIPFMKKNYSLTDVVDSFDKLSPCKCLLLQKGSQYISDFDIPNSSVDLIITDPPYLDQVMYSEYMQLYKPFFDMDFNLDDEIIVSSAPSRNKNKDEYFLLLDKVFNICSKKLKIDHYMCLYFHDSNLDVWNKLISILEKNSFRFVTQMHIKKSITLKNIISPKKSLNGDSILIFIKSNNEIIHNANEDVSEIELNIIRQAEYMVKTNGALSTPELYDNGLMEILIHNGWLSKIAKKYSSLVDLFEKHFIWNKKTCKWEL